MRQSCSPLFGIVIDGSGEPRQRQGRVSQRDPAHGQMPPVANIRVTRRRDCSTAGHLPYRLRSTWLVSGVHDGLPGRAVVPPSPSAIVRLSRPARKEMTWLSSKDRPAPERTWPPSHGNWSKHLVCSPTRAPSTAPESRPPTCSSSVKGFIGAPFCLIGKSLLIGWSRRAFVWRLRRIKPLAQGFHGAFQRGYGAGRGHAASDCVSRRAMLHVSQSAGVILPPVAFSMSICAPRDGSLSPRAQ
jgi:hypothetical protein